MVVALREYVELFRHGLERDRSQLPDRLVYMNVRMLRDIGAPDWLVDRAEAQRQQQRLEMYR